MGTFNSGTTTIPKLIGFTSKPLENLGIETLKYIVIRGYFGFFRFQNPIGILSIVVGII